MPTTLESLMHLHLVSLATHLSLLTSELHTETNEARRHRLKLEFDRTLAEIRHTRPFL